MEELIKEYPNKVWIGFDWKQAEMYFLSLFSKDYALKQALSQQDFHKYVASLLDNVSIDEIEQEQREMAKTLSYNLIYSGFNIKITRANILKKRSDLTEDQVSEALEKYQEVFFCLFNWVNKAAINWRDNEGYMNYFMNAKKFIPVPAYLLVDCESEKLLYTKQGRLAINTYGQGSVGLLLKYVYSNMFNNTLIRECTSQHIPIFDGFSCLVETNKLDQVLMFLSKFITPILVHNNFFVRMEADWFLSVKSWGDMKNHKIKIPKISDEEAIKYEW